MRTESRPNLRFRRTIPSTRDRHFLIPTVNLAIIINPAAEYNPLPSFTDLMQT